MTDWLFIGFIVVLLFMSGFFSGSETALTAASRARMHQQSRNGERRASIVAALIEFRERLIGALLLGNNLVNILASALATSLFIQYFGETGVIWATLVMTALVLIFAEILPKSWALNNPDTFALAVGPILRPIVAVLSPIVMLVQLIVRAVLKIFGIKLSEQNNLLSAHEELRGTVDLLRQDGEVVKEHHDMWGGILDLTELDVSDLMVHRTNMVLLDADKPFSELVQAVLDSPYTRIPLYRDNPDNIIGVIHGKDIARALHAVNADLTLLTIDRIATKPWFVPNTTPVEAQLNAFLKRKTHFAIVIDEYGELEGLITLEDILEEIVGDIADEHDVEISGVSAESDGAYLVDGAVQIRDLNRALDWDLPDDEANTVAGLVLHEARSIPQIGQTFNFHGYRFTVKQRERNRITSLRVTKKS